VRSCVREVCESRCFEWRFALDAPLLSVGEFQSHLLQCEKNFFLGAMGPSGPSADPRSFSQKANALRAIVLELNHRVWDRAEGSACKNQFQLEKAHLSGREVRLWSKWRMISSHRTCSNNGVHLQCHRMPELRASISSNIRRLARCLTGADRRQSY